MDFDIECSCANCCPIEGMARVVITGDPVRGEIGVVQRVNEAATEMHGEYVYDTWIPSIDAEAPLLGSYMVKSPYQGEDLEEVPSIV